MIVKSWGTRGWIALCVGMLVLSSGCDKAPGPGEAVHGTAPDAVAAAPAVSPDRQLLIDMEGVWSTHESEGTDDSEDIYVLWLEDGVLRVFLDQGGMAEWTFDVDDIDAGNGTVTLKRAVQGLEEIITLRRVMADEQEGGGHHLTITYGNGQRSELGFVRRISPADIGKMQAVRRDEKAGLVAVQDEQDGLACASPEGFYESSVCQDAALRQEHRKLKSIFQALKDRGRADIEATEAAAWKQLRACKAKQCILDIYSEWNSYMIVNYTDVFVE